MLRAGLIWGAVLGAIAWPLAVAATSPLLQWRDGIYIAGGLAGVPDHVDAEPDQVGRAEPADDFEDDGEVRGYLFEAKSKDGEQHQ